jgi:hypothetical protein
MNTHCTAQAPSFLDLVRRLVLRALPAAMHGLGARALVKEIADELPPEEPG